MFFGGGLGLECAVPVARNEDGRPGPPFTGEIEVFKERYRLNPDGTLNVMTSVCGQIKGPGMGGPRLEEARRAHKEPGALEGAG